MRRSTIKKLAILCLAALAASGCQAVPRESAVTAGLHNLEQAEKTVLFNPASPMPGANPEEIVRGFLTAASSAADNYAVAREYLAPLYAAQWNPRAGVLIDDGVRVYEGLNGQSTANGPNVRSRVLVNPVAAVKSNGFLSPEPLGAKTRDLRFEFVQINGQWRINSAPDGIVLDRSTFTSAWQSYPLTFITSTGDSVAEERWFVRDTTQLTTAVRHLIAGPENTLALSAQTLFLPHTELTKTVTVKGGEALIQINDNADNFTVQQLELLEKQLAETLAAFNSVTSFRVITSTSTLLTGAVSRTSANPENTLQFMLQNSELVALNSSAKQVRHPLSEQISQLQARAIALRADGKQAAVLGREGVSLVDYSGAKVLDSRSLLVNPSIDSWGYVWSFAAVAGGEVIANNGSAAPLRLKVTGFDAGQVVTAQVSPDGAKIAFLVNSETGAQVFVTAIGRDATGQPQALGNTALLVMQNQADGLDFTWLDSVKIALLTNTTGANSKVTVGGLGVFASDRGSVPAGINIAGSARNNNLRVLATDGRLYHPRGTARWELLSTNVKVLAKTA